MEPIDVNERESLVSETLRRASRSYEFYRGVIEEAGISIDRVHGTPDLLRLPVLTKDMVLAGIPREQVLERFRGQLALVGFTSGSTGAPSPVFYSQEDLRIWESELAMALQSIGLTSSDVVQISIGQCGTGCIALLGAVRVLGAAAIPLDVSGSSGLSILEGILENEVSALLTYPAIARELCRVVRDSGKTHPRHATLHTIILMGEPWTEALRSEIREVLGADTFDIYGSTEAGMVGVECSHHQGLHVFEDRVLVEILDPITHAPMPEGMEGEVVLTPYWKEGLPLVRYGTGDAAAFIPGTCDCGSALPRITRIRGRCRDMVFVGSTKFYPSQLEALLAELLDGSHNSQLRIESADSGRDRLTLTIEMEEDATRPDEMKLTQALLESLPALSSDLPGMVKSGFVEGPYVALVSPGSIERRSGKIPSFIDLRKGRFDG